MDFGVSDALLGRYYSRQSGGKNQANAKESKSAFEDMAAEMLMYKNQWQDNLYEMSFEDICARRYHGAYVYVPPELEEKLKSDPKLAAAVIKELDGILSYRGPYMKHPYSKKGNNSAIVILDKDGKVADYYRQDDGISGPSREELRQIKAEQEAKRKRRERYVKLLKESALKRKLLEQENNKRHTDKVLKEKEVKEKEAKDNEQNEILEEESKSDTDIVVKADGSRVLMMTVDMGGTKATTSIEISKPTYMQNDSKMQEPDENDLQEAINAGIHN